MPAPELIAGPYQPPACRAGDWLDDEIAGRVEVGGWGVKANAWMREGKAP